jgi:aspartate carbamoyltransferase catalytic subunit
MASLFYEPSTRTRFSFESAMLRLGGSIISTENAKEFSSAAKGESLEDSIRVTGNYADVIVLRHFEEGASLQASHVSSVPVINAGDGRGQHPTQALLDMYTIQKELGKLSGIHVAMVGDLKNGRTVRSLAYLLGKYSKIKLTFVSPKALKMGQDVKTYLKRHKVECEETENWKDALARADVVYQTRVQKERFPSFKEYKKYHGAYVLTRKEVRLMKKGSIILHPLPRVGEIAPEVDNMAPAKYFKQAEYGLYLRMALLEYVLGK